MRRAYPVFLLINIVSAAAFAMCFTVTSLYEVTIAHLDPLQLVLVGTTLELSIFLFEIPTGLVADVVSRKLSILIGTFLIGAGFLLEGLLPVFFAILLAQVLWGVGYTFTSGATQAWISDEIGEEKAGPAFLRGEQLGNVGGLVGLAVGTGLGLMGLNIPLLAGGAAFILFGLMLIVLMPENGFKPTPRENMNTWGKLVATFRDGIAVVRQRPALSGILGIGFFFGLYSEGYDRLWTALMLERFSFPALPQVVWFGFIRVVGTLLAIAAAELVQRCLNYSRTRTLAGIIAGSALGLIAGLTVFALSRSLPLSLAAVWMISMLRSLVSPAYTAWVNHRLDSSVRATIISMSSQVDAFGQIAGGPLVGGIAKSLSLAAGILSTSALLAPVLALIGWQSRKLFSGRED